MVFKNYSKYYDLLYQDKDYPGEVNYIESLIKRFQNGSSETVLELGCGTGKHAWLLADRGFQVSAVDRSETMIARARELSSTRQDSSARAPAFFQGDIKDIQLDQVFDIALSLFHVISYINSHADLLQTFQNARQHLRTGGLLIFDVWYGPAVLTEVPAVRIKRLQGHGIEMTRLAEPELLENDNIVKVNYEVQVKDLASGETQIIQEQHSMRYLFAPEMQDLLQRAGFAEVMHMEEWMTGKEPGRQTWGVVCIARA